MRFINTALIVVGSAAAGLAIIGGLQKPTSVFSDDPKEKNPMEWSGDVRNL